MANSIYVITTRESYDFKTPQAIQLLTAVQKRFNGGKVGTFKVSRKDMDEFLPTLLKEDVAKAHGLAGAFITRQKVSAVWNYYVSDKFSKAGIVKIEHAAEPAPDAKDAAKA